MTGPSRVTTERGVGRSRLAVRVWRQLWRLAMASLLFASSLPRAAAETPPLPDNAALRGESPQEAVPLRFRRIYAPADHPEAWPRQQMPYFPMQPDDFEQLVRQARRTARVGDAPLSVGIASAQYKARLVGDDLVDGEATLQVIHTSSRRARLCLEPCGLAISRAAWDAEGRQPATLGQGPDDKLGVLVDRPGRLQLNWSQRGKRDAQGTIEFSLELPRSPSTRLTLELPENVTPLADFGIITKEAASGDAVRRWRIELGGHARVQLRLTPTARLESRRQQPRVRQSLVYDFTLHGLELSAQLQIDVPDEPLRQLIVDLDPGLRLVTARYGSTSIPWLVMAAVSGRPGTRVVLELPEPLQGIGRSVRLGLLAPLEIGARWRLPGVHVEGSLWQEGHATLLVASPLVIEQLTPVESRQVKVSPLPASGSGESMALQYFTSKAGVELVLGRPQSPVQLTSGTAVELNGGQMTARVVADFTVADGEVFELAADAAPHWIIDSVESTPSEALGDWNIKRNADETPRLTVRLAKALSPSRPVRLQIAGRRLHSPLGHWLGVNDLVPLQFQTPVQSRHLVSLRSVEPYQLKTTGTDRLTIVDPKTLDPAAARLLNGSAGPLLFEQDAGADDLRVSVERQSPQYAATIRVEAAAVEGALVESYRLSCIPAAAPIHRLLVRFSHRRNVPLRWTLVNGQEDAMTVRQLAHPEATGGEENDGEVWEIVLQQPKSDPFEIRASRRTVLAEKQPISLASFPEASSQRATLVVSATETHVVRVEGDRLEPIPSESAAADQYTSVRATCRYYPDNHSGASPEAMLTAMPRSSATALPTAWAWNSELESRYDPAGIGYHLALYRLENAGRRQLHVTLPPGAQLKDVGGVWIGDTRAPWQTVGPKEERRLVVDLPAGQKFPVVSLHFTTTGAPLGTLHHLRPSRPELDIPVLSCQWTVWLPPGYQAVDFRAPSQPHSPGPLTWRQRLFGPLGREAGSAPFNPLDLNDWFELSEGRSSRSAAVVTARRVVEGLGAATLDARNRQGSELDWSTALTLPGVESILADRSGGQGKTLLLVDQKALARSGLRPDTLLASQVSGPPSRRGMAAIQQAGLALLVHPAALVLTTELNVALQRDHLEPLDNGLLWWIRSGPLADQVQRAVAGHEDALVRVATWKNLPADRNAPWSPVRSLELQASDTRGWNAYQLEISGAAEVQLSVVYRNAMRALHWTVFLAVAALGCWRPVRRPVLLVSLAGLAMLAALLLPAVYVPFASGAWLGALLSLAFYMMRGADESRAELETPALRAPASPVSKAVGGMGGLLLPVVILAMSNTVLGAEPAAKPATQPLIPPRSSTAASASRPAARVQPEAKPSPATYGVLIPVDEDDKPTGEPYQVPEGLYQELHRRAAVGTEEPQGWILTAATYRGSLVWQGPPERLEPGELRVSLSLEVFTPQTEVRLPLGRQGINLAPDGATLDGRVIQPEWEDEGRVLVFEVAEAGPYQLELALRPTLPSGEAAGGFDVAIPRLAGSQLELTIPANAPAIEIPSARGVVMREADPSRVLAELGPSEQLSVRWQGPTAAPLTGPAIDLEELLWLKVQPDSVVLDTRLRFYISDGRIQELKLQTDPRLRLLPLEGPNAPVTEVEAVPGQPNKIRMVFPRPVSDQLELAASFLLTETSGIGNLRLPYLEVQGARRTKRWLAVWVDPALQVEPPTSSDWEAVAVPVFSASWGPAPISPLNVVALPPGDTSWSLATRPRDPTTTTTQTLALSLDQKEAQVRLDAELETISGYSFRYHLLAPAELEVDKISLVAGELEHVSRWSRTPDGSIMVFLNAPVAGQQFLSLEGRLPIGSPEHVSLPILQIEGAKALGHTVQLFRKPAVQFQVVAAKGLTEIGAPVAKESTAPLGRLVKSFHVQDNVPVQLEAALTANRPTVRAAQRTSVRFAGEQREAKVDFRLQVKDGLVDQWCLEAPAQWSGPYQVDPPSTVKVVAIPGESRRRLVIQPNAAVHGEYRLQVSSPLSLAPGDRVCAPSISLEGAELTHHLLVLPTQWQLHPVVWETQGLRPASLPDDLDAKSVGRDAFVAYQAEKPSFQAILKPLVGTPQVFLAEILLAWQADGVCRGVTLFDLQSAGLSHGWLRLPEGQELVQVTVAGVPATPVQATDGRWQIPLSPSEFPQRLEVLFQGRLAASSPNGSCRLDVPMLDELPVRKTLWTVTGPPFSQPGTPKGATLVSRLEQELIRLRNVSAVIEQAAETTTEEPEQTIQWYRTWARRWLDLGEEIRRQLALPAHDTPQIQAERQAATEELESLSGSQSPVARRLAGARVASPPETESLSVIAPARLWLDRPDSPAPTLRCVVEGKTDALLLDYRSAESAALVSRLGGILLAAAGILVVVGGIRHGVLVRLLNRWPHAGGVLVGLAWWLWLWPSALGGLIVLASVASAIRSNWLRARKSGSGVVTITSRKR
jgi:hypothetical protein